MQKPKVIVVPGEGAWLTQSWNIGFSPVSFVHFNYDVRIFPGSPGKMAIKTERELWCKNAV